MPTAPEVVYYLHELRLKFRAVQQNGSPSSAIINESANGKRVI